MKTLFKTINSYVPLSIISVEWSYPALNISGPNWIFNINCAWRITDNQKLVCGCEDPDASEVLKNLIDQEIIEILSQSTSLSIDPILVLSNNYKLEVFSTTYLEPWIFELPNKSVFVSSPSDPKCIC